MREPLGCERQPTASVARNQKALAPVQLLSVQAGVGVPFMVDGFEVAIGSAAVVISRLHNQFQGK